MDKNGITITVGTPDEVRTGGSEGRIAKYGVGRKCRGKVVNFKPYGFFVETEDGGFGLVHGRNIAGWDWSKRFDRVFRHGTEVDVTVIDIESETNRMSFSCEMPQEPVEEEQPAPAEQSSVAPPPTRREVAVKWASENAEKAQAAYEWLKGELEEGPLYGPLTNVLCDRFEVPVPVSQWIRLYPEFTCYSGQGDNPCGLPAVALAARAGAPDYWDAIKVRTEDLMEFRNREDDGTQRLGILAKRLEEKFVFPSASWIADYMKMARGLLLGKDVYGVADVVERLAIPMLGQLGWDVSSANAALVRGGDASFDIRLYGGTASSGDVSLAVRCAPAGTSFDSLRGLENVSANAVEQVLGLYNRLGGRDPASARIVWTDGAEWVVFTRELLTECIGVLAEHRGAKLMDEFAAAGSGGLRRVRFPTDATPFAWLESFADLHDLIGAPKA